MTDQDHKTFKRVEVVSNLTFGTIDIRVINDPGEKVMTLALEPPVAVDVAREIFAAVERIRQTPPKREN